MRSLLHHISKALGSPGSIAAFAILLLVTCLPAAGQQGQPGFGELQPLEQPTPLPTIPPQESPSTVSADPVASSSGASATLAGLPREILIVFAVGAFVLVSTIIVVLAVVMKPTVGPIVINPRPAGGTAAAGDGIPSPEWQEGERVRVGRAPEGTLKILPGRFVVDDAGGPVEIRIFRTSGDDRVETTIGREPGPPYRHIQFKPQSVSAKHAKLVYDNGSYSIVNYSSTNPLRVNGEQLEGNASHRLVHEDQIEIGEVLMTYYEV